MALFLSTFSNRVDKKGRVSVPASFRQALVKESFAGIVAYASFIHPCIEACGMERIEKLHASIEALDPFSETHDAFATAILAGSVQLGFDSEGRVMLPDLLLSNAAIAEEAVFVGKGRTFEIWEPKAFRDYEAKARQMAKDQRLNLRAQPGGAS